MGIEFTAFTRQESPTDCCFFKQEELNFANPLALSAEGGSSGIFEQEHEFDLA